MGKTIEVRLSDAQHAYLWAEAEAAGQPFFGYCRAKLVAASVATPAQPKPRVIVPQFSVATVKAALKQTEPQPAPADDRIARIEDAVARLTSYVMGQAEPAAEQQQADDPIDVDSIVNAQFQDAEANGLTEHVPDENEEVMQHAGVRPLSRRPMKYSAHSTPRHLQQL
jgi:hypothetical protein